MEVHMSKVLYDTNILIELYKGNEAVFNEMNLIGNANICISDVTAESCCLAREIRGSWKFSKATSQK